MPIYRCNKCGFVSEDAQTPVGSQAACGRCGTLSTVYGTVFFVEELVKRLASATRELNAVKQAVVSAPPPVEPQPARTDSLASVGQHAALQQWFTAQKIEAQIAPANVDTSGFFDDAALQLGDNYALFGELIDRLRYAYRKSHGWVNLELARLPQKDAQAVNQLCRNLYEHTFFARYHYQKPEKIVRLTLQTAPAIR